MKTLETLVRLNLLIEHGMEDGERIFLTLGKAYKFSPYKNPIKSTLHKMSSAGYLKFENGSFEKNLKNSNSINEYSESLRSNPAIDKFLKNANNDKLPWKILFKKMLVNGDKFPLFDSYALIDLRTLPEVAIKYYKLFDDKQKLLIIGGTEHFKEFSDQGDVSDDTLIYIYDVSLASTTTYTIKEYTKKIVFRRLYDYLLYVSEHGECNEDDVEILKSAYMAYRTNQFSKPNFFKMYKIYKMDKRFSEILFEKLKPFTLKIDFAKIKFNENLHLYEKKKLYRNATMIGDFSDFEKSHFFNENKI
jgi:hypothetical protein